MTNTTKTIGVGAIFDEKGELLGILYHDERLHRHVMYEVSLMGMQEILDLMGENGMFEHADQIRKLKDMGVEIETEE